MAEYWIRLGDTPAMTRILLVISLIFVMHVAATVVYDRSVRGSRNRYVSSTIMRTLCLPLFGAYVFQAGLDVITADWFWLVIHTFICYALYRDWNRLKDSDDWWAGKGTMLKSKLRSLFTSRAPVTAGANA